MVEELMVLWSFGLNGGLTGGRERDGGFKYFDNDHVHADDLVDDDEDYFRDDSHLMMRTIFAMVTIFAMDTDEICEII